MSDWSAQLALIFGTAAGRGRFERLGPSPYGHALHLLHIRSRVFGAAVGGSLSWYGARFRAPSYSHQPTSELFGGSPSLVPSQAQPTPGLLLEIREAEEHRRILCGQKSF